MPGAEGSKDQKHPVHARYSHLLWGVIALGVVVRLVLAFTTDGVVFDLQSYVVVKDALRHDLLHAYSIVNHPRAFRWPYPSGFFPFIAAAAAAAKLTGLAFTSLIRVPAIVADAAIAWLVQDYLGRRGSPQRSRLLAAAAVGLGPLFVIVSGYHGQIDAPAILPAVAAIALWERLAQGKRALVAGALIGVGAAIKTVPLLMLIALLPSCRSRREGITLIAAAAGVLALSMAPFLVVDPHGVSRIADYHSLYGLGGLSLLAQPALAHAWLNGFDVHASGLTQALQGHAGQLVTLVTVGSVTLLLLRFRPAPVQAASLLWLTVFAFSINWGPRYAVWGLPFLLMGGHIRPVLVLQVALLIASVLIYARPVSEWMVDYLYLPIMLAVLAAFVVTSVGLARHLMSNSLAPPLRDPMWRRAT